MDKSHFEIISFENARPNREYWMSKTAKERLRVSWSLTCAAFNIDVNNQGKMDKEYFDVRSRD